MPENLTETKLVVMFGKCCFLQRGIAVAIKLQAVQEPALMAARLASRVSRSMHGRKVDVLLKAPNLLEQPIHRIATQEGVRL